MDVRPGYKQTDTGMIPNDWEVKRLGELASVSAGGTPSRSIAKYWNGDIPWITTSELDFGTVSQADQFISREGLNNSARNALLPNNCVLPEFLLHSLTHNGDAILARCLKSGTTVESIEFRWLKQFTIPIPTLLEQNAIADILSELDAEIASLEARLDKARALKQGMMQELLTGRIRLV